MAYFSKVGRVRVELPSDPRYWVEIKERLRYGERQRQAAAYVNLRQEQHLAADGTVTDNVLTRVVRQDMLNIALLTTAIVAWNFDRETGEVDADGDPIVEPLPVTPENVEWAVENLEPEDGDAILRAVNERIVAPRTTAEQVAEKNAFTSSSSKRSRTARR